MSLYAIKQELLSLTAAAEEHGIDSPELEQAFAEHRAGLVAAFEEKADDYAALVRVCETRAAARREEMERLKLLAADDERLAERLRATLMDAMQATGQTKVETSRFRLSVRKNGGKVPVIIEDEASVPPVFRIPKVTEVLDKDGIRSALEAGTAVPGAVLGERGSRLELK